MLAKRWEGRQNYNGKMSKKNFVFKVRTASNDMLVFEVLLVLMTYARYFDIPVSDIFVTFVTLGTRHPAPSTRDSSPFLAFLSG